MGREPTIKKAERVLRQIARREGTSVESLRMSLQVAIINDMIGPEPGKYAQWSKVPRAGKYPTPEELLAYLMENME